MLERDNRGIGVENPTGVPGALGVTGSKQIFKVDNPAERHDVTPRSAGAPRAHGNLTTAVTIVPVTKLPPVFIDLV